MVDDQEQSEDDEIKEELKFIDKKMEIMGIHNLDTQNINIIKGTMSSDAKRNMTKEVLIAKKKRVEKTLLK